MLVHLVAKVMVAFFEEAHLEGSNISFPYYFIGDNAFPLLPNLMRPYPGLNLPVDKRNFNKILSKCRSRIEISFGILSNRWRVLHTTINASPKNVDKIILAAVLLHNFLIFNSDKCYYNPEISNDFSQNVLEKARVSRSNHPSSEAFNLRTTLKDYLQQS